MSAPRNNADSPNVGHSDKCSQNLFGPEAPLVDMRDFPGWIIYEDGNFLVVNKPGWLVCHPSKNGPLSSLAGAAREYLGSGTVHLISRLDRETSGIVIFAKNKNTASTAQKALQNGGLISKKYIAILRGRMLGTRAVSQPLADDKKSMVAIKTCCAVQKLSAKKAFSLFIPLAYSSEGPYEPCTLVKVEIKTGRKHQIRAHAQWMGHEIVGDKLYGPDESFYLKFIEEGFTCEMARSLQMKRQALHAYESDFSRVFPDIPKFKAPLQSDMVDFMKSRGIICGYL